MRTDIRNFAIREQEKLREKLKTLFQLRDSILKQKDDAQAFNEKPKGMVLNELDEIIDFDLEQFYSLRAG